MTAVNRQLLLRARPAGVVEDDCFELVERPVPDLGPGQVLVRTRWLSFDPTQRGWLNDVRGYMPPVGLGEVMRAYGIGEVITSNDRHFEPGDVVHGLLGWQELALIDLSDPAAVLETVPGDIEDPKAYLGVLGITGLTAYVGMLEIGRVRPGDTVLVTAAAGATGSVAGQVARIAGAARVVGTAGSDEKRAWVREVAGFDECVSHHDDNVRRRLREAAPDGYDLVFDNVGGTLLDATLFNLALNARIVLCGSISSGYRPERPSDGLFGYQLLTTRRARMEGFIYTDHAALFPRGRADLQRWIEEGRLRFAEDILEGLEQAPSGLRRLFAGGNLGKQLLRLAP